MINALRSHSSLSCTRFCSGHLWCRCIDSCLCEYRLILMLRLLIVYIVLQQSSWSCLKSSGYNFAIVRVYQSNGKVDPNGLVTTLLKMRITVLLMLLFDFIAEPRLSTMLALRVFPMLMAISSLAILAEIPLARCAIIVICSWACTDSICDKSS